MFSVKRKGVKRCWTINRIYKRNIYLTADTSKLSSDVHMSYIAKRPIFLSPIFYLCEYVYILILKNTETY